MTRNKSLFTSIDDDKGGKESFGDGEPAKICGKNSIMCDGIPKHYDVLYIVSLKETFSISVSSTIRNLA